MSAKETKENKEAAATPAKKAVAKPEQSRESVRAAVGEAMETTRTEAPKAAAKKETDAKENAAIRAWAKDNGMQVGRGRIPAKVREAYKVAQQNSATTTEPEQEAPALVSADEIKQRMAEKAAEKQAEAADPARRVVVGTVVDGVDQEAVRQALENPEAAKIYNEAKPLVAEYVEVDGRATELLRQISHKLMDLRALFNDGQGRVDWNGTSPQYLALAASLLREAGIPSDSQAGTRRAIGHHIEDRKRERVPQAEWADYGVQALTRGQRAGLEKKQAKALVEVDEAAKETTKASKASKSGTTSGTQMVALARKIDQGISAYHEEQLVTLTPSQRNMFRQALEETREKTNALLAKLNELDPAPAEVQS